jgi:hypothetical protein
MRPPRLYVRDGDRIVEAPDADQAVVDGYAEWEPKGEVRDGVRLTIMAASTEYRPGEPMRVIHVLEATEPGVLLYVMGPKPVLGEYVDGELRTPDVPAGVDPLVPANYDGRVLAGPGIDVNWEITEYRFDEPAEHTVHWRPGSHESNELIVTVS